MTINNVVVRLFFLTRARVLVVGVLVMVRARALSRPRFILVRLLAVRSFMCFLAVNFTLFDANSYLSSTFVFSSFAFVHPLEHMLDAQL